MLKLEVFQVAIFIRHSPTNGEAVLNVFLTVGVFKPWAEHKIPQSE